MVSGINYVLNPRPETNTTSWSATNATVAQDSTLKAPGSGTFCIKATATATGVVSVSQSASGLTIGQQYSASVFCRIPAAVGVNAYGTAAGNSGQNTPWATTPGVFDRWTRIRVSFYATSATQAITWTTDANVPSGQAIYFDRMAIVDGPEPGPYFDGGYPQCSWSGTAFASTSTCSPLQTFPSTSSEPTVIGGLNLNTAAWNIFSRAGRRLPAAFRGGSTVVPGQSGAQFTPNRPIDAPLWTASMWILGCLPDGTRPTSVGESRRMFEENVVRLQQAADKAWQSVSIYAWQPDGTCRKANAQLSAMTENAVQMGGMRGEYAFTFEILDGWWKDALASTTTGTPSASWSGQALNLPMLVGGAAPIEDSVFTVTGPATNPRITSDSGVWVQLNATLAAGTTWVVDSGAWTSTRAAVSNLSEVSHGGHQRFLSIPSGELLSTPKVTMNASGTSSATNLAVTAARSHMGA